MIFESPAKSIRGHQIRNQQHRAQREELIILQGRAREVKK